MRNDAGENVYNIPQMPLDICVADSQGGIGYMIERMLRNIFIEYGIDREIVTIVTQVLVKKDDPAFNNPTKRIGKIYTIDEAKVLEKDKGWEFRKEVKKVDGWRRVVPSPAPISIMNEKVIMDMANKGVIVITVGGGGIPVYIDEKNKIKPTEAVIDKDLASSLLAARIKADEFYVLTDVPYVYINYKQADQEVKEYLNREDTLKYLDAGMFSEGSMAPKIRAALQFIEQGGSKSVITEATKLEDKKYGTKITMHYDE
jgi:carbamate kinase